MAVYMFPVAAQLNNYIVAKNDKCALLYSFEGRESKWVSVPQNQDETELLPFGASGTPPFSFYSHELVPASKSFSIFKPPAERFSQVTPAASLMLPLTTLRKPSTEGGLLG